MDPQGNLTDHLWGRRPGGRATPRPSIYDVLVEGLPLTDAVVPTSTKGLSVVPSHEDLAGVELDLASVIGREVLLRDALAALRRRTPSTRSSSTAPRASGSSRSTRWPRRGEVFIALQTEFFAMRGLARSTASSTSCSARINPRARGRRHRPHARRPDATSRAR